MAKNKTLTFGSNLTIRRLGMKPCRNLLKRNLLKILFFLIAGCLTLPSFAFAEDKIQGKYEVIGSIEKLKGRKTGRDD